MMQSGEGNDGGEDVLEHKVSQTLLTSGHGTIVVKADIDRHLRITVHAGQAYPNLSLRVESNSAEVCVQTTATEEKTVAWSEDCCPTLTRHFLSSGRVSTYWFSLDRSNGELRYGKSYVNATTMLGKITGVKDGGVMT